MSKRKRDFDHHDNNSIRVKQELSTPTKTRPDLIPLTTLLVMIDNVIDKMEKKAQLSAAATNHEEPSTGGDAGKANDNNGLTEPSKQNGTTNNVTKQHIETGRNSTKTNGTLPGDPVSQTSSDPAIPRPRVVVEQPILKSERVSPIPQEPEITSSQPELNGHDNNAQVRTEPYTPNLHSPKIDTSPPPPPQQQQQQQQQQDVLADGKAKVKTEPFSVGSQGQNGTPLVKLEPREVKQEIKLEVKQETMYSATNGHGSTNGTDIEMPPVEQSNDLMKPNYNQDPTAVVEEPPSVEQAVTKLLQDHILNKFD